MNRAGRKQNEDFYKNSLSNYRAVMKDTGGRIVKYPTDAYNCMGYAFGIYDWLDIDAFFETDNIDDMNDCLYDCAAELEERYGCRRIKHPKAITKHERVIAMRVSEDDFHFARLNSDGTWTHKPGFWTIRNMTEEELYSDAWCDYRHCPYISEIIFFAVKIRQENYYVPITLCFNTKWYLSNITSTCHRKMPMPALYVLTAT